MKASDLIEALRDMIAAAGDQEVLLDTGYHLCAIDDVDLGASDEGIIIWAGDVVEEPQEAEA